MTPRKLLGSDGLVVKFKEGIMIVLLIVALLFVASAFVHFGILVKYGKSPTSVPVAIFGLLYLCLSILLGFDFYWVPYVAFGITVLGLIGATTTLKSVPEQRTVTLIMNGVDIVIIGLLGYYLFR